MKTVASFREVYPAHLARGRLEAEGIRASVIDENIVRMNWALSQAVGGVKVQVHHEDLEKAREILGEDFNESLAEACHKEFPGLLADVCPQCGSSEISPKRYSKWSLIPSLYFLLPLFFPLKRWECRNCGRSWR